MESTCSYNIAGFIADAGFEISEAAELYSTFLEEMHSELANAMKAFTEQQIEDVKLIVHNIKGISINYRITDVHTIAEKIDDKLKENDTSNIEENLKMLFSLSIGAEKEIKGFFAQHNIKL